MWIVNSQIVLKYVQNLHEVHSLAVLTPSVQIFYNSKPTRKFDLQQKKNTEIVRGVLHKQRCPYTSKWKEM